MCGEEAAEFVVVAADVMCVECLTLYREILT